MKQTKLAVWENKSGWLPSDSAPVVPPPRRTRSGEALREPPRARVGEALRLPFCSLLALGAGAGFACQCGTRVRFVVGGRRPPRWRQARRRLSPTLCQ